MVVQRARRAHTAVKTIPNPCQRRFFDNDSSSRGSQVGPAQTEAHGFLVCYEMLDDTQTASANVAVEKARTAAMFRRATKEFEDNIAGGRVAVLGLPGVTPIEGGLPIVVDGKMIGAVGVSGMTSAQDAQVAKAGLDALNRK